MARTKGAWVPSSRWKRGALARVLLFAIVLGSVVAVPGVPSGAEAAATNPFSGTSWFIDPNSNARRQADEWRATRPVDAAAIEQIAGQPQADWFGDFSGDVRAAVDARATQITTAGALPLLVAYNAPNRDCGGLSNGGATSIEAYRTWIRAFADGIGSRRAVVIMEPNGLTLIDCLSAGEQTARFAALADAVSVLKARPQITVYIAAGHSNWLSVETIAQRLGASGIAQADGFALNISNSRPTSNEISYGQQVAALVGGKHFVVDTSRNGLETVDTPNTWCNLAGLGLGHRPAIVEDIPLLDAFLWIKRPGESDGACNNSPPAGQWWPEYALGLAQRAALDDPIACFPTVNLCVGGQFLRYWRENGGLALNGYPVSDVLMQTLDDGKSYRVQYFERVRLEAHPENQPPYDILLGQFGRKIVAGVANAPTAPVAAAPGKRFFPETNHNVGGAFLAYWQANGGLSRFGYPLTEEFTETLEDGKSYTVQYFERARFEYHPENDGTPYNVLLGQFGRRIYDETKPKP